MTMVPARNLDRYPVLMTPAQVGDMFRVEPRTVRKWEKRGLLTRAGDGPLRFDLREVRALYERSQT